MKRLLFLIVLLSTLNTQLSTLFAQEYRDVVFLKNGSVIKGFYKEIIAGDSLRMETLDGSRIIVPYSDIQRIAKEKTNVYVIKETRQLGNRKWRPRGYRGFIEYFSGLNAEASNISVEGLSTYHGYQFNQYLFLGAGLHVDRYKGVKDGYTVQPESDSYGILANVRWYIMKTRITPFIDLRGGYHFTGFSGPICIGGAGADFGITPRMGINIGLYYQWLHCKDIDNTDIKTNAQYIKLCVGVHF